MKLYWKLHETAELHTEQSLEDAGKVLRAAAGMQFRGKEEGEGWSLSHNDRNFFRPALQVKLLPDEEGTLILAEYRADKTLLLFMCIWSLLVIGLAFWRNLLLLLTLLLFWGAVIAGFSIGVRQAHQDLMDVFGAYEIVD